MHFEEKMKLFQIIQKKFAFFGITSTQSIEAHPFNEKILLVYVVYGSTWISSVLFLVRRASTFEEYTNNIYITTATAMIIFCFTVVVLRMPKLFEFINKCERLTERGEENANYVVQILI